MNYIILLYIIYFYELYYIITYNIIIKILKQRVTFQLSCIYRSVYLYFWAPVFHLYRLVHMYVKIFLSIWIFYMSPIHCVCYIPLIIMKPVNQI